MDNLMSFSEGADPSKQRKAKSNRWSGASNSDGSSDKAAPAAAGASAISDIAAGLKRFELEQSRLKKAAPLPAAKKAAAPAAPAPAAAAPAPANAKAGSPDDADWVCTGCAARGEDGTVPKGFKFCPICGDSFHGTPNPKAKPPAVAEEWQCEGCGEVSAKRLPARPPLATPLRLARAAPGVHRGLVLLLRVRTAARRAKATAAWRVRRLRRVCERTRRCGPSPDCRRRAPPASLARLPSRLRL